MTDVVTSRDAAHRLGVSVAYFHRLVELKGLEPAMQMPRARGEKLWNPADIDALEAERAAAKP